MIFMWTPGTLGQLSGAGFRYKKLRDRENFSLSLN